jgi:hypothetical protein
VEEFLGLQFDLVDNLTRGREKALEELSKAEKEKSGVLFKLSKMQQRVEELERGTLEWAKAYSSLLSELVESLKRTIAWAKAYSSLQSELLKRLRQLRGGESLFGRLKYLFTGELV